MYIKDIDFLIKKIGAKGKTTIATKKTQNQSINDLEESRESIKKVRNWMRELLIDNVLECLRS